MSRAESRTPGAATLTIAAGKQRETDLYVPVKRFLAGLGYDVKGEVGGCDVVGMKPGEPNVLVIIELKNGFTLELVLQGVERLAAADAVWLAVPATRRGRDRDRRAHKLCRLLGFGLLTVSLATANRPGSVVVLAEPAPYRPRPNLRRRTSLIAEHRARRGDHSPGGTNRTPIMTAYRQEALACARQLRAGTKRPRELKDGAPRAASILQRNVYGWFERTERGVYGLTSAGTAAIAQWPD